MKEWQTPLVLGFLLMLRCLSPVVLVLLIGYGMNKLSDRLVLQEQARQAAEEAQKLLYGPTWVGKNCVTPAGSRAYHNPAIPAWLASQRVCGCRKPDECLCSPFYNVVPV